MRAKQIHQEAAAAEAREPEFAKQVKERNRHTGDGGVHKVDRPKVQSAKRQLNESHAVEKPPRRRYVRPSALPAIRPTPGYHFGYVRRDHRNVGDYANLRMHQRAGWEIVRASELDEEFLPTITLTGYGDCIGNEDSVLMKIDSELWSDRNADIDDKRDARTRLVNSNSVHAEFNPAMPIEVIKNQTSSSIERGARTVRGDDE